MGTDIIPIETLGADIKARVEAGDKALDKAEQHYIAAGIQLIEAKKRISATPGLTWPAFLNGLCGIRRRRADDLIAIANGTTTLAEMRGKNRERVAAHRNRKKAEVALRNAESERIATAPIEKPSEGVSEVDRLKATIAKLREQLAEKESARRFNDARAAQAEAQRDKAQTEAAFLRADNERLTTELVEAKAEIVRLLTDMDALTKPTSDSDDTLTEDQIPAFLKKEAA